MEKHGRQTTTTFWRCELRHAPLVGNPASVAKFTNDTVDRLQKPTRAHMLRHQAVRREKKFEQDMEPNEVAARLALQARQTAPRELVATNRLARCATGRLSPHVLGYLEQLDTDMWGTTHQPKLVPRRQIKAAVERLHSTPICHAKPAALSDPPRVRLGGNYDYLDEGWYNRQRATRGNAVPAVPVYGNGTYYARP